MRRVLAATAVSRDLQRLQARAEALAAMGLAEAADATRKEMHAAEEDRRRLVGWCEALRHAAEVDAQGVTGVLHRLDPSGVLQSLLHGGGS